MLCGRRRSCRRPQRLQEFHLGVPRAVPDSNPLIPNAVPDDYKTLLHTQKTYVVLQPNSLLSPIRKIMSELLLNALLLTLY